MYLDVQDLRNFYYRTSLGRAVQRVLRDQLVEWWPPGSVSGQSVCGFGFAAPLLRPFLATARRVTVLMPGPQGVMPWPFGEANVSVLCEETIWPLDTGSVDRLVLLHALEASERSHDLLTECWRVLRPGGRLMIIVPNRAGLWARRDMTPFGHGRPYSNRQVEELLRRQSFFPERSAAVLYQPPSHRKYWLKSGPFWERLGRAMPVMAAGAVMVEASKQIQAPVRPGLRQAVRKPLVALEGIARPEPSPGMALTPPGAEAPRSGGHVRSAQAPASQGPVTLRPDCAGQGG